jgi:hypothetical protein
MQYKLRSWSPKNCPGNSFEKGFRSKDPNSSEFGLKSGGYVAEVHDMVNPEPSIKSQNKAHDENPPRDLLSPAIAIGGLLSTVAAQRVGEPAIRLFSTITGLLASAFGASAYAVGRKSQQVSKTVEKTLEVNTITLPNDEPIVATATDELTVIVDLENQPASAPSVIDLSQGADELADR